MSTKPCAARLRMRFISGYGESDASAFMLEQAFAPSVGEGRICALRVPFESDKGPVILGGVRAIGCTAYGLSSTVLPGTDPPMRAALGGIFFTYVHEGGVLRVGPPPPMQHPCQSATS